jgi:galactokinase
VTTATLARVRERLEQSGLSAAEARTKAGCFVRLFDDRSASRSAPAGTAAWFVPGRIEVLGKHTDYAGGRSLVCAVERGFCVVARPRADDLVRIADLGFSSVFEAHLRGTRVVAGEDWFLYPAASVARVARDFPSATRGLDARFQSDLPQAGGLSSSSALVTAVLLALAEINGLETCDIWHDIITSRETLACYAAAIENGQSYGGLPGSDGVGTAGGSEDHVAILCSKPGTLSQYAFRPVRPEGRIQMPADLLFAVGVSGIAAHKTGDARARYNRAARLADRVLDSCNQALGRRHTSLGEALGGAHGGIDELRAVLGQASDPEFGGMELRDRFDQFLEESEHLVPAGAQQLGACDLAGFGRTAARSQQLAERLLRNQIPETTTLVTLASDCGAVAASAFGAGFGGSVWALIARGEARAFLHRWAHAYRSAHPAAAADSMFFLTRPGPAALRLPLEESPE